MHSLQRPKQLYTSSTGSPMAALWPLDAEMNRGDIPFSFVAFTSILAFNKHRTTSKKPRIDGGYTGSIHGATSSNKLPITESLAAVKKNMQMCRPWTTGRANTNNSHIIRIEHTHTHTDSLSSHAFHVSYFSHTYIKAYINTG